MRNPEDIAADRHKEIAKARERIAKADAALVRSRERQEELRARLISAEVRDRERLGAALIDSKPEPPSEAAKVKAELEREQERTEALVGAAETARREIPRVVEENRAGWIRRGEQEIDKARRRYEDAIVELAAAREALDDEATLAGWLRAGTMSNAATDLLGGRPDPSGRPGLSFSRTLELLREDVEHLVAYPAAVANPDPIPEPRRELVWTSRG